MKFLVYFSETFVSYVGINLCGGYGGVAEECLNTSNIGAVSE